MKTGKLIWITGLAGAGKTTLAKEVYKKLKNRFPNVIHVDGEYVRQILSNEYGHDIKDRLRTARIYARLCNFLTKNGMIVIMSTISLFHEIHEYNAKNNKEYYEIFLNVNRDTLLKRNKKKLYTNKTKDVMGINQTPQFPKNPSLILSNDSLDDLKQNTEKIINLIKVDGKSELK